MIVLDASLVVKLLMDGELSESLQGRFASGNESFAVPHLLDVEVVSALRSLAAGGRIELHRVEEYLTDLALLPAERYSHSQLLGRVWDLRHNFTAYDAVYIALAEDLNATLYTTDAKLRRGHHAKVVLVDN